MIVTESGQVGREQIDGLRDSPREGGPGATLVELKS